MGKSWDEVAESPEFQQLAPDRQARAKQLYFEHVLAPKVPAAQRERAWQLFASYQPKKAANDPEAQRDRTADETLTGLGAAALKGAAAIPYAGQMVAGHPVEAAAGTVDAAVNLARISPLLTGIEAVQAANKEAGISDKAYAAARVIGDKLKPHAVSDFIEKHFPAAFDVGSEGARAASEETRGAMNQMDKDIAAGRPAAREGKWNATKGLLYDVGVNAPQLAASAAVTAATRNPSLGAGVMAATMAGQTLQEGANLGLTPAQNFQRAAPQTAAEFVFSKPVEELLAMPAHMLASKGLVGAAVKKFGTSAAGRIAMGVIGEAGEEGITQMAQDAYDAGALDQNMTFEQFLKNALRASAVGGLAAAPISIARAIGDAGANRNLAELVGVHEANLRKQSGAAPTVEQVVQAIPDADLKKASPRYAELRKQLNEEQTKRVMAEEFAPHVAKASAKAPPATPPPAAVPTPAPAPGQPAAPPGASGAAAGPSPDQDINAQFEAFDAAPQQEATSPQDQQVEAAAGRIGDGGAVAAPQEGQAPPEAAAVPGEEAGAGTAGPGQGRDVEAPLNAPLGVIVKNEDGTMSVVPDPDSDRKMAELRAHNAKVRAEFNAEQEAAKAPAGNGVGSDAGNGWLHGPEGSRVNVGSAIGTGGVLMDKQYRAGTRGTFYIGKDGNLVDADNIIANKPETYGLLWRPDDADQRRAGEDALREFALASTKEEKKAARDKIKAVVNQEQTDAGDGQPGAGEQVAAAPAEVASQAAKEGEFPVQRVDVGSIEVSPQEYQFRSKVNAAGVDDRMAGVKQWDDLRADPLILHRRKDGRLFVADGHHRLELAKRLGVKDVNAVILDEADGYTVEGARKKAALKNLASGNGTPLDAAKVFRAEPGDVDAAIERHNLPNNSAVRQGAGLAKLSDETFGAVVNGLVTERDGAVIGDSFKSPEEQAAALKVFQKIAPQNREQAQILAQQIKQAGFGKKDDEQTDMFGAAMQDSLLAERVKLIDAVGRSLKNDKAVFAGLERNASRVESAGNRLERDANKRIADESAQLAGLIGQLSATDQDISRALNEGARKLKDNPGSMQTVLAETREAVRHAAARITGQRGNASQDDGDAGKPPAAAASRGGAQAGERVQPAAPAAAVPVAQPAEAPGLELAAQKDRASEIVDSSYGAIGMAVDTPSSIADERTLRNIKKLVKAHPEAQPLLDVLTGAKRLTKAADAAHPSDARAAEEFFKRGLAALPTELLEKVDKAITRIVRAEDDSDAMYATAKAMGMSDAQAKAAASWSTKTASKSKTKALTGERSEPKVAEPVPDYQTEPPPLTLEAQTEESRLADEKAVAAAEKAEKEAAAKAKADKDRAGFTLSGSASEADQAAAAGQLRLLEPTEYGYDHERGAAEVRSPRQGPQSGRPNSPANAGRGDSSPVPGQLDLFAAQGANHPPAAAVKKLRLLKRVKSVVTGFFRSGVERVTTAAEAAHIIAPLRKEAQESMLALVTDVDGKPLSVIRHSIGKTDSASVEIASVLGAVHAVPGAKHVWFAHNHPSGEHRQSSSDNLLTRHLTDLLKGTGVESRGMIVVAPGGKATVYEPDVGESTVKPTAARRTTEVPITQRRIVQVPGPTATIGEPRAMEAAIAAQPEAEGLLLLDTQLRPVGFLPMSAAEMAKLRTGDSATGAGAVMRAIESSGATRVAVKIETDNAAGMEAVRNIKGLAEGLLPKDSHGLPGMLDAVVAGNSIERTGRVAPANKPYAAMAGKGSNASGAVTTDAARSKVATFFGRPALRALDSKKLLGFAASVSDLPPHLRAWANARHGVHAFYDPDHAEHGTPAAWIIADRLESVDDVPGLVLHEIGVHFGLKQMLKADEFAKLLASLSKDASPAVAEAWAHVLKNYKHKEGSAEFREEVLARSTQQARFWEAPLWKRVLSRIRQFLFRLGFTKSLSDEDLGLLVARSLRRAIAKGSEPVAAQGREVMAAYEKVSNNLMGFRTNGPSKAFDEQRYKHVEFVRLTWPDGTSDLEAQRGLNKPHALERARRNWDYAVKVETVPRSEVEKVDPELVRDVDEIMAREPMAAMGSAPLESAKEKIGSPKEAAKLPLKERITQAAASAVDDIRHADVDRFEEGTFDRLLPIKNLAGMVPYMAARMSTGTGSVTYASMMFGAPQLKDRVIQHKEGTVGLMQVLQPVKGELQDFVDWLVGKRSEWLSSEEGGRRENNLSLEEISALVKLGEGREDRFEATAGALREFNTDLLRLARDTGLLSNDQVEAFTKDRYYVPFYRVDESAGGDLVDQESAIAPYTRRGLSHQSSGIKRLKGGTAKLHDPLENMLSNMSRLIDASLKNYALARTVTSAADHMTIAKEGDRANAVRVYWMGRPHWFNVSDDSLLRSLKAVGHVAGKSFIMDVMRGSKRLLTAGVTAAPPFMVRNFMRDAMHAWIIDKNGFHFGIDSIRGARASMGTLFHAAKNPELADPSIVSLMFAGSSFLGGNIYGTDAKESATALRRAMVRSGMTQSAVDGYMKTLVSKSADFWHFYREMGDAVENANRVATFNAARAAGKSVAEAAFEAKDLLDYSLRGQYATLQVMADVLPFFNARMQGLYKIARELRRDPKLLGVISAQVAMRALPMMLASIALMAMYRDDDRYNDLEEWDKDANWHFWLGGAHIRIPKPFELGLLFGTLPERMFRAALRRDTPGETAAFFGRSVVSTLAVNPLPQLVRPGVESFFNFDMFKWRPIEGMGDQRKLPEQRYGSYTSPTMVEAGNATGLSPKQLEHIWNGYLGTMGTYALGMTDALIHAARKDVKPEPRIGDYPLIGSFVRTGPEWSNKWMTELYDLAEQANQTRQAINDLRGSESPRDNARAESLQKDNDKLLGERMRLNHATKRLGALRKLRDDVTADNTMTPKEKRERLDELQTEMNDVSRETVKETRQ